MFTFELPPQPPWEGLHPLVIHFPIALLFVAPVFVLLAALLGKYGRKFGTTALLLLVMGTISGSVAVQTGDAAFDVLEEIDDDGWTVVEEHQDAAKSVQRLMIGLTIVYAVILVVPLVIRKFNGWKYYLPANLIFLALLMVVNIQLANAAHLGGRLVHQYGARAMLVEVDEQAEQEAEAEAPVDESMDEPADEPADATAEEPAPAPADEAMSETPAEEAAPAESAAEKPASEPAEQPTTEQPPKEEPAKEEPASEEPAKEEPAKEEPASEEPAKEEPTAPEPAEPSDESPTTE